MFRHASTGDPEFRCSSARGPGHWRHATLWSLALLTVIALLASTAQPVPAAGAGLPVKPTGIYVFYDWSNLNPAQYPIVGGHMPFLWDRIETKPGVYTWTAIDNWLGSMANLGKHAGLKIDTYVGQARGGTYIPARYITSTPQIIVSCPDGSVLPRYWDASYQEAFGRLVRAFGARFGNDPRIAWVEISAGIFGETAPAEDRFDACLQAAGLTSRAWIDYVNWATDTYRAAFPAKQLFLQYAPRYLSRSERREFTDYAAGLGIGLKHNGVSADPGADAFITDPMLNIYRSGQYDPLYRWGNQVATGFEGSNIPTSMGGRTNTLWSLYNALDKHVDLLSLDTAVASSPDRQDLLQFASRYLGRTLADAPSVWVALRETEYDWFPDYGNYEYWLYQNDAVPGGQTVPLWNITSAPEGRYTRRTDQASGNPAMYFDVDDGFLFGGSQEATIRVTYLDRGFDTWELQYASGHDIYQSAGIVTKGATGQWVTATFPLVDIQFANRQPGGGRFPGSDFRIISRDDGDETIHFVEVIAPNRPAPPPTPTPTAAVPTPSHSTPRPTGAVPTATPTETATPMPTRTPTATATSSPTPTRVSQAELPPCPQASNNFILDGELSEWFARPAIRANQDTLSYFEGASSSPPPAPDDLTVTVWCAWHDDGLVLAAEITDDNVIRDSADATHDDGIEFLLAVDGDTNVSEAETHRYSLLANGGITHLGPPGIAEATLAVHQHRGGWSLEFFIPSGILGTSALSAGQWLGLTFALNDNDNRGERDHRMVWRGPITPCNRQGFVLTRLEGGSGLSTDRSDAPLPKADQCPS